MFGLRSPVISREHTESYYAATAPSTSYPQLEEDLQADVIVIGGGFSGVNTALELSERGLSVVLLEAHRIGWGASGRNGGQVIGGITEEPERFSSQVGASGVQLLHELGVECVDIIRERVAQYSIDCDLVWGYCDVALKPRHMRWLQQSQRNAQDTNYPHPLQLLDRNEVKAVVGSDLYLGGLYDANGAGHLHPLKLCQAEAAIAASLGARVFEQSEVLRIEHGDRPRVATRTGNVSGDHLVLCGNAYLDYLEPCIANQVVPASSCIIATEPLAENLVNSVLPANVAVCDLRTALDYFRLSTDRRLLFGGLSNYTGLVPTHYRDIMYKKMLKVFPQLQGIGIDYAWDGQLGIGINRMPQAGLVTPNTYYIQAFSGHGVAPTHVMARLVAEAICGDSTRLDVVASVRHRSIPGGRFLKRPAMAAGMLYYKALDHL